MDPVSLESRRATVEDLESLETLWREAGLPATELGKFLTEFQVVISPDGRILHCIGLLVEGDQALLHSEALPSHPTVEPDACRSALWRRLRILARNQGISRIWTREDAEFWAISGYESIPESGLPAELPSFVPREDGWRVYHSPDPTQADLLVKRELALWQTQRELEKDSFQQRVKAFRAIAVALVVVVVVLSAAFVIKLAQVRPDFLQRLFR
jgi:N-acetylglutamate synthase-like GNAT family acetyltransferase